MTLFDEPLVKGRTEVIRFKDRILEGIGEGWSELFKGGDEILYRICADLYDRAVSKGEKIYPTSMNIFRCFKECKLSNLKVVLLLQDPYHQPNIADGLALSCGISNREQPSLKIVFDEVQKTAYHYNWARVCDLTHWANQGILLLNTALTVKELTPDSHTELWRPFISYLMTKLDNSQSNLVYVFLGNRAKAFSNYITNESNTKIQVVHPAAAAHRGGVWDSEGMFPNINSALKQYGKEEIRW